MSAQLFALALCFAGVFCLTPLAIYLIWVTHLNKGPKPVVISAQWDFLALIVGLLGFLIFGAMLVVNVVHSNSRYWSRGNVAQMGEAWGQEKVAWLTTIAVYLAVVLVAIVVGWIRKRRTLAVYCVELESLLETVDTVVKQIEPASQRMGYTWAGQVEIRPMIGLGFADVVIQNADVGKATELELNLRRHLPHALPAPRTAAAWFSSASLGTGIGAICSLGLVLVYVFFVNR